MITEALNVQGMSCSNCVGHVTRALESLPGTSNVAVYLNESKATVDIDPDLVSVADLIAAIEDEGYSASPAQK